MLLFNSFRTSHRYLHRRVNIWRLFQFLFMIPHIYWGRPTVQWLFCGLNFLRFLMWEDQTIFCWIVHKKVECYIRVWSTIACRQDFCVTHHTCTSDLYKLTSRNGGSRSLRHIQIVTIMVNDLFGKNRSEGSCQCTNLCSQGCYYKAAGI